MWFLGFIFFIVIHAGILLAYLEGSTPPAYRLQDWWMIRKLSYGVGFCLAILGPFGTAIVLVAAEKGKYGFKLW